MHEKLSNNGGEDLVNDAGTEQTSGQPQRSRSPGISGHRIITSPDVGGDAPIVFTDTNFSYIEASGTSLLDKNNQYPTVIAKTFPTADVAPSTHLDPTAVGTTATTTSDGTWSFKQGTDQTVAGNAIPGAITGTGPGNSANSTLFIWYQYSGDTTIETRSFHALSCALFDTFTESTATAAQDHKMNKGPKWSSSTQDDGTLGGTWTINNNNQISQTWNGPGWTKIQGDAGHGKSDATGSVTIVQAAGGSGLVFRLSDAGNFWRADVGTNSVLYLVQIQAGQNPQVWQTNCTYAANAKLTVVCLGNSITVSYNGATIPTPPAAYTNFNINATQWGLAAYQGTSNPMTNFIVY
jgi:hypothetical protein